MFYRGHVENGVIVVDDPVALPEGAPVRFALAVDAEDRADDRETFADRFAEVMGQAKSLPEDAAENHDHYLYGLPKK
jgi:hypothetical protein